MLIHAKSGHRGLLIDLTTNQPVRKVKWADVPADPSREGEYEAFRTGPDGLIARDERGKPLTYRRRARLRFQPTVNLGPGEDDPAPPARPVRQTHRRLTLPLFSCRCEGKNCSRLAGWAVSDEVPLPPAEKNGRRFARAQTVRVRYYCDFCYIPPRLLDAKGEVIKVFEEAGGVRPS